MGLCIMSSACGEKMFKIKQMDDHPFVNLQPSGHVNIVSNQEQ